MTGAREEAVDGLDELYRTQRSPLLRLASLLTGSSHVAEDVVQEAFLRFAHHLGAVIGIAAGTMSLREDDTSLVAGSAAGPEVVVEHQGLTFRAVVAPGDLDTTCLEVELPPGTTATTPIEPVCIEADRAESFAVGSLGVEHPVATVVLSLGGPGIASVAGAVDQVTGASTAEAGDEEVFVSILVIPVADATGTSIAMDPSGRSVASASFGAPGDDVFGGSEELRRAVEVSEGLDVDQVPPVVAPAALPGGWSYSSLTSSYDRREEHFVWALDFIRLSGGGPFPRVVVSVSSLVDDEVICASGPDGWTSRQIGVSGFVGTACISGTAADLRAWLPVTWTTDLDALRW